MPTEDNSVVSPPFPSDAASSFTLYRTLVQFRQWLREQQEAIKPRMEALKTDAPSMKAIEAIGDSIDKLKEPDNIPNEAVWEVVSVTDKFVTLQQLQQCREIFDHLLRRYESMWDEKVAVRGRYDLIMFGHFILQEAFVDPETREARQQKAFRRYMRQVKALRSQLNKMAGGDEDNKHDKEKFKFDGWDAHEGDTEEENDDED